jgi:hypothetical protein
MERCSARGLEGEGISSNRRGQSQFTVLPLGEQQSGDAERSHQHRRRVRALEVESEDDEQGSQRDQHG